MTWQTFFDFSTMAHRHLVFVYSGVIAIHLTYLGWTALNWNRTTRPRLTGPQLWPTAAVPKKARPSPKATTTCRCCARPGATRPIGAAEDEPLPKRALRDARFPETMRDPPGAQT